MKKEQDSNLKAKEILKDSLSPKQIVAELDRFIVGQAAAKKSVAIALRNRYRRKAVREELRDEIVPKNILMIGPTGVGKTEIARRLAKLANAPFIKIEATKFTEVGYVGRDVDSVIRDLMEIAINMLKAKSRKINQEKAKEKAEDRIIEVLVGKTSTNETKEKFREMLKSGKLEDKEIEIKIRDTKPMNPMLDIGGQGGQMGIINIGEMLGKALGSGDRTKKKRITVKEAWGALVEEETENLMDDDLIVFEAKELVENDGIVFLDEIDKIASREGAKGGGDISREGVQRDLLPLIEGTTVSTKYGSVNTDHILFIASGAFHLSKPSDLLPELQGRLPIRVELSDLSKDDMVRILKEPEASLIKQYIALIETENVHLTFTDDAIEQIAEIATAINKEVENIGARRLHTLIEKLLEDISFTSSDSPSHALVIDLDYVNKYLGNLTKKIDLSKFIL